MNWMTETDSYLDGEWKYYISIEFQIKLFNKKNELNDWNWLLSGWWMEVLHFYRISDLIIQ